MACERMMRTEITGITYLNDDGVSRRSLLRAIDQEEVLHLRDLASDKYPEAIGIFTSGGDQFGYLPQTDAQRLRALWPCCVLQGKVVSYKQRRG